MKKLTIPLLLLLAGCEALQPLAWYKPDVTIEEYNTTRHLCLKESLTVGSSGTPVNPYTSAFTDQSKQPAINGKQRMSNAMMSGFGAGFAASSLGASSDELFKSCMYAHGFSIQRKSTIINAQK